MKKSNGVFFKLFLGSLNMKRLSSDIVFFTLVKAFEESSFQWQVISFSVRMDYLQKRNTPANHDWKSTLRYYFTPFRALGTKSYKKGPFGVFFCGRSDSLNMKGTEFYFIGLVKLNIQRPIFGNEPLLSQVRKIYEFRIVFGWVILSVCYPIWTCNTEKRHSSTMMGGNGKGIILQINGSSLSLPLNMALVCISFQSIGYSADLCDDPLSFVMPLLWVFQKNAFSVVTLCVCLV